MFLNAPIEHTRAGPWLALELGVRHERETVAFWEEHSR
jgi:hypothetical protein